MILFLMQLNRYSLNKNNETHSLNKEHITRHKHD